MLTLSTHDVFNDLSPSDLTNLSTSNENIKKYGEKKNLKWHLKPTFKVLRIYS